MRQKINKDETNKTPCLCQRSVLEEALKDGHFVSVYIEIGYRPVRRHCVSNKKHNNAAGFPE